MVYIFKLFPVLCPNKYSSSVSIIGCVKDRRRAEKKDNLKEVATLCNTIGHIYAKYGKIDIFIQL